MGFISIRRKDETLWGFIYLKTNAYRRGSECKVEFVKEVLIKNGAEIETVVPMGTRKLAYKIKKYERGTYFVIYFKAPTNLIAELERVLRITEEVIRFLIVKYENKKKLQLGKN